MARPELSLCMIARQQNYDLRRGSFKEGWHSFLKDVRYQPAPENLVCRQCEHIAYCDQCPGWSSLEHGDADKPVEFICQVTHLRAAAFDSIAVASNEKIQNTV